MTNTVNKRYQFVNKLEILALFTVKLNNNYTLSTYIVVGTNFAFMLEYYVYIIAYTYVHRSQVPKMG